jgi:succinylglutamic semialdehyde dehydrogenase
MSAPVPMSYLGDFINGVFVPVKKADGQIQDVSPADLKDNVINVPYSADHVDRACDAARAAYLSWARRPLEERKMFLLRLREAFANHADEFAQLIYITLNHSLQLVKEEHIPNALPGVEGVTRFKSRGVMAVIGPFNFPAHLPNGHIIPALIAGNTVVYKPSEQTPAVGQLYAKMFERAEFPAGVFNMIHGVGETGRKLVLHEQIDGILFTGSYEVGHKIKLETLTHYWKILALEMGGKNATMIWKDADMDKAVYERWSGRS